MADLNIDTRRPTTRSSTAGVARGRLREACVRAASVAALVALPAAAGAADEMMAPAALVDALRGGGLVAYVRHATTETDYADQVDAVPDDCSTQRTLSEEGWHQAKAIGEGFAAADIPVGEVLSSEYCRAWQTADLAFGRYDKRAALNFAPAEEYSEAQIEQMREGVVPLLGPVEGNGNRVIVGHDDPFEAATGIYPEPMGVTYVIRPGEAGAFEVLGMIPPSHWSEAS